MITTEDLNNLMDPYMGRFIPRDHHSRAYITPAYPGGGFVPVNTGFMGSWESYTFEDSSILYRQRCMREYHLKITDNIRKLENELCALEWKRTVMDTGFNPLELILGTIVPSTF